MYILRYQSRYEFDLGAFDVEILETRNEILQKKSETPLQVKNKNFFKLISSTVVYQM